MVAIVNLPTGHRLEVKEAAEKKRARYDGFLSKALRCRALEMVAVAYRMAASMKHGFISYIHIMYCYVAAFVKHYILST